MKDKPRFNFYFTAHFTFQFKLFNNTSWEKNFYHLAMINLLATNFFLSNIPNDFNTF